MEQLCDKQNIDIKPLIGVWILGSSKLKWEYKLFQRD